MRVNVYALKKKKKIGNGIYESALSRNNIFIVRAKRVKNEDAMIFLAHCEGGFHYSAFGSRVRYISRIQFLRIARLGARGAGKILASNERTTASNGDSGVNDRCNRRVLITGQNTRFPFWARIPATITPGVDGDVDIPLEAIVEVKKTAITDFQLASIQ